MFRCCVWLPESIFSSDAGCLQPHAEIMWPGSSNTLFVLLFMSRKFGTVLNITMLVAEHASRSNIEYMERLDKLEVPCIAQFSLVCSRPSWLVAAFNPVIMLGLGVRDGSISSETANQFYCVLSFIFADDINHDITIADGYTTRMPQVCYFNPICVGKLGYSLTENRAQSFRVIIFPWT